MAWLMNLGFVLSTALLLAAALAIYTLLHQLAVVVNLVPGEKPTHSTVVGQFLLALLLTLAAATLLGLAPSNFPVGGGRGLTDELIV